VTRRWAVVFAAGLLAACTTSTIEIGRAPLPTTTTPVTTATTTGPDPTTTITPAPAVDPIQWEECGSDECATVDAPLDYADPGGATIELAVRRIPADGERTGALFFNPGGPGGSPIDILSALAFLMPDEVTDHFDVVAMDPRGVGASTPVSCGVPNAELYGVDPTIDSAADRDAVLDVSRRYVEDCAGEYGDLLPHLGTRNVARDMDLVRAAMGDPTINYLGYSYGTSSCSRPTSARWSCTGSWTSRRPASRGR
jgi:hypothetical protein